MTPVIHLRRVKTARFNINRKRHMGEADFHLKKFWRCHLNEYDLTMAMSRKREQSDLKVDILIDDVLQHRNDQVDLGDEENNENLKKMSEHLERRLNEEEDDDKTDSPSDDVSTGNADKTRRQDDGSSDPASRGDSTASKSKPTLDDILDEVDAKAKSKVVQAEELDQRRLTKAVNPIIKAKAEQSRKASAKGWIPFCVALIVIGVAWMVVGFCTAGEWPIPFFGGWNMACGGFLIVYGGLMLLGWR